MSPVEFGDSVRRNEMRLALVGMSNAGKTTLSKALSGAFSFTHAEVDSDIGHELSQSNIHALADWLGLPGSEGHKEREKYFLDLEEQYTLLDRPVRGNFVLDTTGSVVHLSEKARERLRDSYMVVHLDVGNQAMDALIERYFAEPKPVVWGEHFEKREQESTREALVRCYPELLRVRLERYRALAHVNVPTPEVKNYFGLTQYLHTISEPAV